MTIPLPMQQTTKGQAICPYCGVGCRLSMESVHRELIRVKGVADAPANLGGICAKGATLPEVIQTPDRLTQPNVRAARGKDLRPTTWVDALRWTAARFREIIDRHGPDAVAFYGSGQLDSEAGYLAVKLFKGSIGTNNTDSNSRLCMASAVAGYRTSLGADGPPCCYADIELSDCLVVWGSNMAEAFPVAFDRVKAHLKANPSVDLIVVDPRRTTTANYATLYVPVVPGGDIPLMNVVGRLLLDRCAVDDDFIAAHTEGFKAYREFLLHADWEGLVSESGVPEALIRALAERVARSRAWLTFYCQGLNQSTVRGDLASSATQSLRLAGGAMPVKSVRKTTGQDPSCKGRVPLFSSALNQPEVA
jgi:assimilatory nitrate reductase catalytic subunit